MKKRLIAFLLSLLVVVSGITPVFAVEEQPQAEQSAQEQTQAAETAPEELTEEEPADEPGPETQEETGQETAPTVEASSGTCGENLTWTLDDAGTLTISGTGAMKNYSNSSSNRAPWYDQRSSIRTVVIGDGVTSIGNYAFYDCDSLASVTIPDSVTSIGDDAFAYCTSLASVEIPDSVTSIGDDAFAYCDSLTSVTIGNSVTSIGASAFYYCTSLTSVEIPDSVTSIGNRAFRYCTSLASVTISDSVTSIGDEAFCDCDSLMSVEIPDSVTSIGYDAFYLCDSLTSIHVAENNPNYCSADGVLYDKAKTTLIQYPIGNTRTDFTIPDSVTSIGDDAFYYCTSLASVTIGNSVTSIGDDAFYYCTSLASVEIPDSVTSIGNHAFAYCDSLTSVEIPDSVTSIGNYAFYGCDSLASVEIPDSVTSIGYDAFYGCDSLTSICVAENNLNYCSADGVLYDKAKTTLIQYPIGNKRTSFTIPDSVTSIGDDAFYSCDSLTSVEIPDSVTRIGDDAFEYCDSLTSVAIGNSVTSIGGYAFYYCTSLTEIYFRGARPSIWSNAFYKVTATAYYPSSWTSVPSATDYGATNITWVAYNPGVSSGEITDGIQLSDQSIVVGKTDSVSISIYRSNGGAAELAEAAAVSVADSGIATVQKTGSVTGSAGGKSAAFTVKVTGKKVGETELTVTCGDSVSKTVKLSVTEPRKIDVNETDPEKLKEQLGIDKDSLAMDDITISMGKLKGPTFQLFDHDMTLFSLDSKVNLDLSKLGAQIMIDPDDKTVKVAIGFDEKKSANVKPDGYVTSNTDQWKKSYNEIKSLYQDVTGNKVDNNKLWNKYESLRSKLKQTNSTMVVDVKTEFAGYLEFSYASGELDPVPKSGGITAMISTSAEATAPLQPAFVFVTFGVNLKTSGEIEFEPNLDLKTVDTTFALQPEFTANIGLGAGKKGALAITNAYVEGGLKGTLGAKISSSTKTSSTSVEAYLKGSFYVKAVLSQIFKFEDSWELAKFQLWPRSETAKTMLAGEIHEEDVTAAPRLAASVPGEAVESGSVVCYGSPQTVTLENGNRVLMWLGDVASKADDDRTTMFYSVYDASTGEWSGSAAALENNAYNGTPVLCSSGNQVYLVWQRASKTLGTSGEMDSLRSVLDLWYSEFDGTEFAEPVCVSENGNGLAKDSYSVASDGTTTAVAWLENSENDVFNASGTNTLYLRTQSNGVWGDIQSIRTTEQILDGVSLSVRDGKVSVSYRENSEESCALYVYTDGSAQQLDNSGTMSQSEWFDGKLYYLKDNVLYVNDGTTTSETGLSGLDNFRFVSNGTKTCLLTVVADGYKSEIYRSDLVSDAWTPLVPITNYGKHIQSYSAEMNADGRVELVCSLAEVDESAESIYGETTLEVSEQIDYYDLIVDEEITYDTENVVAGEALPLTLTVHNNSSVSAENLKAEILDAEGNVLQNSSIDTTIAAGEKAAVTVSYNLPEEISRQTVTVKISSDREEISADNNSADVEFGYADLSVENVQAVMEDGVAQLKGTIVNRGYEAAENIAINFYDASVSGEQLNTISLSNTLEPGASQEFVYYLPEQYWSLLDDSMMYEICVQVTTDTQESRMDNNEARIVFGDLHGENPEQDSESIEITTQPSDYTGAVGENAVFTIEATGKVLTYQWQYQNVGTDFWQNSSQSGNKTASLSVPITGKRNGQKYRCVVTDASGNTVTSDEATLIVAQKDLQIVSQPSDYTGAVGDTATFTIEATGTVLTYQWQYQNVGTDFWQNSSQSGNKTATLSVPITEKRNGQKYRCVVTDADGNSVTSDEATLIVEQKELQIVSQPSDYTGTVGDTATFTIEATGTGLTYQWQYQNVGADFWQTSSQSGNKTATLSVPITEKRNGQKYRCVVTDASGNTVTSNEAVLRVDSELAITTQPSDYTGAVGDTATFTIEATGEGLTYQWQYQNVGTDFWQNSSQSGNKTATLSIPITEKRNGQKYRCVVTDASRNTVTSDEATLLVAREELQIVSQPKNYTGEVGEKAVFTIEATGTGLTYQWQYQNVGTDFWQNSSQSGNKTTTLSVPITEQRNGQKYRCVVTDVSGNSVTSDTAAIVVK